jgi:O-antigen/teichoic acid export membrane protein
VARNERSAVDARGHGSVAVGLMVGNILGYALALLAARRLGPTGFGELSALLALVIVLAVVPTGLQTVTARAVAEGTDHPLLGIARASLTRVAVLLGLAAALPLVALGLVLHLAVLGCILVALTVAPLLVLGWAQGVAQGQEQLGRLAALLVLNNGGRAVGAVLGIIVWRSASGAVAGALLVALLVAGYAMSSTQPLQSERPTPLSWASAGEVVHASAALLALFLCTGADVVLARAVLTPHDAGIYAAGAVVAKMAFWLPQFAAVTALPRLVDPGRRKAALRVSLVIVCASSALLVLGCLIARGLVVDVVGGQPYEALSATLPWFALLGGLWALAQVFLFDALARRVSNPAAWLWLALAALVVIVLTRGAQPIAAVVVTACLCAAGAVAAYAARARLIDSRH